MEMTTLKDWWQIYRTHGLRCLVLFWCHRIIRHECWVCHEFEECWPNRKEKEEKL